jgi:dTMP kinase
MKRGRFITLEGGEGVGKTTNIAFIRQFLEQRGLEVCVTREPGGTPLAEQIRALLLTRAQEPLCTQAELLLVFAARAQHVQQVILPALQRGAWVVCDRFIDATYAYQGGGRGMELQWIAGLEQIVLDRLRPDLTLLLDAPVELGMQRAQKRGALDRFESEQRAFFERVRQHYLLRATQEPQRFCVLDARQTLDDVQQAIAEALERLCRI